MAKKTNKARQKKQMRSKERKRQKRQKKQQQSDAPSGAPVEHGVPGGPGDLDVQAPEGFRAAGMSQALMEYIQPLLDRAGDSPDIYHYVSVPYVCLQGKYL